MPYFDVPDIERESRCYLSEDLCAVDDERFFIRGCLDLPVRGYSDVLTIGVWVEVEKNDMLEYQELLDVEERDIYGPYPGKLSAPIPTYESSEGIKVELSINNGIRPSVLVVGETHPLYNEQKLGLPIERLQSIYAYFERRRAPA